MNNDIKSVLPLGSVVLLKDAKRYLVVMGYLIIEEGTNKIWDVLIQLELYQVTLY